MSGIHTLLLGLSGLTLPGDAADVGPVAGSCSLTIAFDTTGWSVTGSESGVLDSLSQPLSGLTIRMHVNSGDNPSGTLDSDIATSSSPSWVWSQSGTGLKSASVTLTLKSGGATIATRTATFSATVP